jgi:hypothetical protein
MEKLDAASCESSPTPDFQTTISIRAMKTTGFSKNIQNPVRITKHPTAKAVDRMVAKYYLEG